MAEETPSQRKNRQLLSRITSIFKRRQSGKTSHELVNTQVQAYKRYDLSTYPEMVIVTEFSRGLGRRIPYYNEDTFAGIVTIHQAHNSGFKIFSKSERGQIPLAEGNTRSAWCPGKNMADNKWSSAPVNDQFSGINELNEPTRSLLIADICQPMTNWDFYVSKRK